MTVQPYFNFKVFLFSVSFLFFIGSIILLPSGVYSVTLTEFPTLTSDSGPLGIAAGPDGNLWFVEGSANKIGRITTEGTVEEFSIPTPSAPDHIVAGPDGNLWFTEGGSNQIGRITPSGMITEFPLPTPSSTSPDGITSGPDGNLWFTEEGGDQIGRITPNGDFTEFPLLGGSEPRGIALGPDGNLWFTEGSSLGSSSRIGRITPSGVVTEFPVPTISALPHSITSGPDGNLWFTEEAFGHKIGRITPAGIITEFPIPTNANLRGITLGPDGNIWFTEVFPGNVGQITINGDVMEFKVGTNSGPEDIISGPDGNIWFTDFGGSKIWKLSLDPLKLSSASYSLNESDGTITITVNRGGDGVGEIQVDYSLSSGSATEGSDFPATAGTLDFADGEMNKSFTVTVNDDGEDELDETFNLTLQNPFKGARLGNQKTAIITIVDNDTGGGGCALSPSTPGAAPGARQAPNPWKDNHFLFGLTLLCSMFLLFIRMERGVSG